MLVALNPSAAARGLRPLALGVLVVALPLEVRPGRRLTDTDQRVTSVANACSALQRVATLCNCFLRGLPGGASQ
eukprot:9562396-Alexandrium_andersonii.AAC.1